MSNGNNNSQSNNFDYYYSKDEVHSDYAGSDKYYGKVSTSKSISLSSGVQTDGQINMLDTFDRFYRSVYTAIERRADDPQVAREELVYIADNIYNEILRDDPETFPHIHRLLKQLYAIAPDVYLICVTVLTSPMSEFSLSPALITLVKSVRESLEAGDQLEMQLNDYLERELIEHPMPPEQSAKMREELVELQSAVTNGNVQPVRQILHDLTNTLPGMRLPLRSWLVESNDVPTAIKVFARNYLDRA